MYIENDKQKFLIYCFLDANSKKFCLMEKMLQDICGGSKTLINLYWNNIYSDIHDNLSYKL